MRFHTFHSVSKRYLRKDRPLVGVFHEEIALNLTRNGELSASVSLTGLKPINAQEVGQESFTFTVNNLTGNILLLGSN